MPSSKQYKALLKTEEVDLEFEEEAIREITDIAQRINEMTENIGARRLYTVMEKLLDDISFTAPDLKGQKVDVSKAYVLEKLGEFLDKEDLSRYIL